MGKTNGICMMRTTHKEPYKTAKRNNKKEKKKSILNSKSSLIYWTLPVAISSHFLSSFEIL